MAKQTIETVEENKTVEDKGYKFLVNVNHNNKDFIEGAIIAEGELEAKDIEHLIKIGVLKKV